MRQNDAPVSVPPELRERLPRTLDEFRAAQMQFLDPRQIIEVLARFRTLPSDIIISTFPKCGTTWMQQIVHGLRSRGSMDFEEISLVVPWIETSGMMGLDVNGPQAAAPRAFKSHLAWHEVPKGARYIYVMRDPKDALVSFYHFMNGAMFEADAIPIAEFASAMFLQPGPFVTYWSHVKSWWEQRHRKEVRIFIFEHMKRDLPAAVRRVAEFMGLDSDAELLAKVTAQSSFSFMNEHQNQFDEHVQMRLLEQRLGLKTGGRASKVRAGRVGDHGRELPEHILQALDDMWHKEIGEPLGIASYEELCRLLA